MGDGPEIRERMAVVGSDGQHVGTVDRLERGRIKLTRDDDPGGAGEHRAIPLGLIASVEGGQVRLTLTGQQARALAVGGLDPSEVVEDGTVPMGGVGTAGGAHGDGTGGGGTSGQGYLGGGGGIVNDPNMDPGAAAAARDGQG